MKYYLLSLKKIPFVYMAHRHINDTYDSSFLRSEERAQIVFIEQGEVKRESSNLTAKYKEGSVMFLSHNKPMRLYCESGRHCHMTVGFMLESPLTELSEMEVLKRHSLGEYAILPEYVEPSFASKVEFIIKKIISVFNSSDTGVHLKVISYLFDIFAYLTNYSVEKAMESQDNSYSKMNLYCRKAISYIAQHLSEKITVQEVAAFSGISYGYLSNLFSECTGMTIVEYINREKLRYVKDLITTRKITLEEAGFEVGISDVKYLSRLFKKYNGITSVEYKKLKDVNKRINSTD